MTDPEPKPTDASSSTAVAADTTADGAPENTAATTGRNAFNPRLAALYAVGALVIVLAVALVLATISSSRDGKADSSGKTVDAATLQLGASNGNFTATTLPNAGMVTMKGKVTDLPNVVDGKPTVINLFSYSCTACRTEMPALEKLHRQSGDRFQMVGVNLGDSAETTASFVKQTGVTYTIVRDPTSLLVDRLNITAQPMTLWVDANGRIVGHRYGAMNGSEMRADLDKYLGISLPSA